MTVNRPLPILFRVCFLLFVAVSLAGANSSLDLSASNGYAFTSDAPALDFDGSFTIEMRFITNVAHDGCLLAKFHQLSGSASDDSYYISVTSDGGIEARIQTLTMLITLSMTGSVHDFQWHHVALVYDIDAEIAELYLDGELGDSAALSGTLRDTAEALRLGTLRTTSSLTDFFDGNIDELRLWSVARRGEQASCLKDVTLLIDTPGLISYYPFDEETGTTSNDLVAPFENFSFISGAGFSVEEPVFLSRLSGPGACFCGEVSGFFAQLDPAITFVGDTITVPEGDTLAIESNTLILDSTVALVNVLGKLAVTGTAADSAYILGQFMDASDAEIHLLAPDTITAELNYTRISGLSSRPLHAYSPLSIQHATFSENSGGALFLDSDTDIDSCSFTGSDSTAIMTASGLTDLTECEFTANGGALSISAPCSVLVKQSNFYQNVKSGGNGGAIEGVGDFNGTTGSYLSVSDCEFTGNMSNSGGAVWLEDFFAEIQTCQFEGNSADLSAGGLRVSATAGNVSRIRIDSTDFTGNIGEDGSAISLTGVDAAVELCLSNAVLSDNFGTGGAVAGWSVKQIAGNNALIERCQFFDNNAESGATSAINLVVPAGPSSVTLQNLTIVGNTSSASAVYLNIPAIVRNCIVTDNLGTSQIGGSSPAVVYCITSDEQYHGPGGSFDADPLFEDYLNRDLRLTAGSPAINRGDPNPFYNDADGTRSDIGAIPAADYSPVIQSVLDIPADNGRHVMIQWLPSPGDDNRAGIESYQIFREVNLPLDENYELLAEIPASQLPGYGQIVTTLADSNASGQPYFSYFVRAHSINPLAFWDTEPDSGYSVDNLAPQAPALLAELNLDQVDLNWNAVPDSDLAYYALYRETEPFDPDTVAAYITTADTFFSDIDLVEAGYAYRVRSVDMNGNYSESSNEEWVDVQPLAAPRYLTIHFNGSLLELRWIPVPEAARYHLYRANTLGEPGELFATTTDVVYYTPITAEIKFYWIIAER
ncbi:hypothetical protein KKG66_06310 [bacterium]|nr:hypothetical protein [bacterium]